MSERFAWRGSLVLADRIVPGRLEVADGRITAVEPEARERDGAGVAGGAAGPAGPFLVPGFIDVHVHGWGGHDAMGDRSSLEGMALALARRGVTSFLPTAVSAPIARLAAWADDVRAWIAGPRAADASDPLGFNLEGPFLSPERRGAHDADVLRDPAGLTANDLEPLLDGLRLITIAPERPGALELISRLSGRGVRVSLGHSAADLAASRAGIAAGASSTTHLFNAMTGLDHRAPGLAAATLLDDTVWTELIADGHHVHPALYRLVARQKPADRLLLVSDAIALAGTGDGRGRIGGLEIDVRGGRVTLVGTDTLAGSVIALDDAVRGLVAEGIALSSAVAAASADPAAMLGLTDRGRLAPGLRADLVELDDALRVSRVWIAGRAIETA